MDGAPRQVWSISTGTIIRLLLVLGGAWFLFAIRGVVAVFLVSILLAAVLDPIADWFEKRRVPRSITVLTVYIIIFLLLSVLLVAIIPPIIEQTGQIANNFGALWQRLLTSFEALQAVSARYGLLDNLQQSLIALNTYLTGSFKDLFSTIGNVISGFVSFFIVLVIAFFLVVERDGIRTIFNTLLPKRHHDYIAGLLSRMQHKVGEWLLGQLILMLFVGVLTYIGLIAFDVKYALLLAVIAGATEIIPYAGPVIATIPAVFFATAESPTKGLIVLVLYFVIQRIENVILVPKVMQKTTGLNPVLAILALAIGYELGGIAGVLLSIPVATAANVILTDYLERQNRSA